MVKLEAERATEIVLAAAKLCLPKGYKKSEIGVIPEDWEVKPLDVLITSLDAGVSVNSVDRERDVFGHDKHILKTSCVIKGKFVAEECKAIVPRDIHRAKLNPRKDSIVISRMNTPALVGECGYIDQDYRNLFLPDRLWMTRHDSQLPHSVRWLAYILCSPIFNRVIKESATGTSGSMKNISKGSLLAVRIPFPPSKTEQEAIAEALSDADAMIESLEQLITKKRQIKQGAMQELLAGKKRLPGFGGKWRTRLLGEVITHCSSGATPYRGRSDYYKGKVKWITSGELNYNLITETLEHISDEAKLKTNLKIHPVGTFLMAITGLEAAGTRGACGIVGSPASTNQSCMAIYPSSELKAEYLYHYYVLRGNDLALRFCQGTKQQSYTAKLVKLLPITLPPKVEEQTAIATILSDMDAEIAALEGKLTKAQMIKQGMMQELLTGKVRLI